MLANDSWHLNVSPNRWKLGNRADGGIKIPSRLSRRGLSRDRVGKHRAAPVVVQQNAFIDITEPLLIGSGRSQNVAFRYITGEPAATAFGMQWWASERDARNGLPPLTQNQERPSQVFLPEVPQPNTGEFQDGIVAITVPEDSRRRRRLFWSNYHLSSLKEYL